MDWYTRRQATPHPSKYKFAFCTNASATVKPKEVHAREIHENDPFNKGRLLTYYCHLCNERHFFHKGDVIVTDGTYTYYSDASEEQSAITKLEVATLGSDISSNEDSMDSPIMKFSLHEHVCCADELCVHPKGLTATVLCYDCHDDFHHNLCGEFVEVFEQRSGRTVGRSICSKCYNLCGAGRDVCKHPGEQEGRVLCTVCSKPFHFDGCGYEYVRMLEGRLNYGYRCKACLDLSKLVGASSDYWKCKLEEKNNSVNNKLLKKKQERAT
jgi:RNase P subunit RPR2